MTVFGRLFFISLLVGIPTLGNAADDKWIMPVQSENLAPFKHRLNGGPGGIEVEITQAIAKKLGIPLDFPQLFIADGRRAFTRGLVNVDCCLNEIWFQTEEARASQLFSDPLYNLIEIFVFKRSKAFPVKSTLDLKNKRVAGIAGFSYPDEDNFGQRVDGKDVRDVLDIILRGDADVAVLERHAAALAINSENLEAVFGDPYYRVGVSLRLHKSQEKHLEKVNKAIRALKAEGEISEIIKRNLR